MKGQRASGAKDWSQTRPNPSHGDAKINRELKTGQLSNVHHNTLTDESREGWERKFYKHCLLEVRTLTKDQYTVTEANFTIVTM